MMSKLTQLRDEATRLQTVYHEHKHSNELEIRRKVHLDLDKFLMEHRETAILLVVEGLNREIDAMLLERRAAERNYKQSRLSIWRKLFRRDATIEQ